VAVDGVLVADPDARAAGRGAYVCDAACYERACARGGFQRALRRAVAVPAPAAEENVHLRIQ
jgi:predicted RNA-binding protein YlxR (DUF448 family)